MNTAALRTKLISHALASGLFDRVSGHEPKNAPGSGISGAIWLQEVIPLPDQSSLAATTCLITFNLRIYTSMLMEPQDDIDPLIADVADKMFTAYSGDFDLGGSIRAVDLLGMGGAGLSGQAGYLEQDGKMMRVFTIAIPLIVNDAWSQSA